MFMIQVRCPKCRALIKTFNLKYKLCMKCGHVFEVNLKTANLVMGNFKLWKRRINTIRYETRFDNALEEMLECISRRYASSCIGEEGSLQDSGEDGMV